MSETAAPRRRAALAFIFVTVVLDIVALGVVIPVLPQLIQEFAGSTGRAGWINGLFVAVWSLMQFVFSPIIGSLSDRWGRRPVLLISSMGLAADYALMALAPNLWWLALGRILSGITAASISTAFAYIADVVTPEKRAQAYGYIGACFGLGFVMGPALGGLLGEIDLRLPFWAAGALSLANGLYGLFVLPESLARDSRTPFSWRRANPLGSLQLLRSHPELFGLALVNVLAQFAHYVLPAVFALYAIERYDWGPSQVGWVLAGIGVCAAVIQGLLTGRMVKRFGERTTLEVALICGATGFAIYGLAPNGTIFWLGVPVMSFWGMAGPASQALMTRLVSPGEQGQLQGANMSLGSLTGVIAPIVFGVTFAFFVRHPELPLPGAPFLVAAALLLGAALLAWRVARLVPETREAPVVLPHPQETP
ncbi:MAG TPA: TCR/Tet family MFS transporter [Caulobacteraceae bacterium]|jgi:DHA1 family tetracycline resistance protein-like MFS transporter